MRIVKVKGSLSDCGDSTKGASTHILLGPAGPCLGGLAVFALYHDDSAISSGFRETAFAAQPLTESTAQVNRGLKLITPGKLIWQRDGEHACIGVCAFGDGHHDESTSTRRSIPSSRLLCSALAVATMGSLKLCASGRRHSFGRRGLGRIAVKQANPDGSYLMDRGIPVDRLTVGIPRERDDGERRVAATIETVHMLINAGFNVMVESEAGRASDIPDDRYEEAGARVEAPDTVYQCDILLKVNPPSEWEVSKMKPGATLIGTIGTRNPGVESLLDRCQWQGLNVIAMDSMPRMLSRAQSFDTISSMANVAGYRSVVEGAAALPRFMAGQFTETGKAEPAKVLVIGAGVAGLQAIQCAKNLGAVVRAFDVRASAKDEIESAGAEFLQVQMDEDGSAAGGYAKEMSEAFLEAEMALFRKQCQECDLVITTALIPGSSPPVLITKDMVDVMKKGSVVVDLAAANGGNCEATRPGETVVTSNGVTIIGTDLLQNAASQASQLYANNVTKFLLSMGVEGRFYLDENDEAVRGCWIIKDGEALPPPPPRSKPPPPKVHKPLVIGDQEEDEAEVAYRSAFRKTLTLTAGISAMLACGRLGSAVTALTTTLSLACLVGTQAVAGVQAALHSPLMSVTTAMSGLTAVCGLAMMGGGLVPKTLPQYLAALAVFASMINVSGGFIMTGRMLQMFKREGDAPSYSSLSAIPGFVFMAICAVSGPELTPMVYLVSSLLCIMSICSFASQQTAPMGNALGLIGVAGGLYGTVIACNAPLVVVKQMLLTMTLGSAIGGFIAKKVEVTSLPQLVAAFHSLVGVAATATAWSYFGAFLAAGNKNVVLAAGHITATYLAASIGALTATGSIMAFGKLQGILSGKPLTYRFQNVINAVLNVGLLYWLRVFVKNPATGNALFYGTGLAALLGYLVSAQVAVADIPVVITLLNSASGWALAAEGLVLSNSLLTIVGCLIGASGAYLSNVMCVAINRSVFDVLGLESKAISNDASFTKVSGDCSMADVSTIAVLLNSAKKVVIVPGYGIAVSKGQYALAEIMKDLTDGGVDCKIAIHPVAGRVPGQLDVLLAEAGIPYDKVFEMEDINQPRDWENVDVALVVGANDTINSLAEDEYGMPVVRVWQAQKCIVIKRSLDSGYADLENPVFYNENTQMLLGDAKVRLEEVRDCLRYVRRFASN